MWLGAEWLMRECKREQGKSMKEGHVTEEKAQRFRVLTALSEDLGSIPSTHIGQLTTACDSSSRESDTP